MATELSDLLPELEAGSFESAEMNPQAANAAVQAALEAASPAPDVQPPSDDLVTLPGGLVVNGEVIRTARVRELNGEHEEALAKASIARSPFHFTDVLLECGVHSFGTLSPDRTRDLLKEALVGDRDMLILGIRRATYGDVMENDTWECPKCGVVTPLTIPLDDIPVKKLDDVLEDTTFEVPRRKGGHAKVRLANGADAIAAFGDKTLNVAQSDSITLARCITALVDPDGTVHNMEGMGSLTRFLSIPDRRAIIKAMSSRQPGPRFNEVKFMHNACGEEVTLLITLGDLFLDL